MQILSPQLLPAVAQNHCRASVQFREGRPLQYANTPSHRSKNSEDEDDEYENEAPTAI
jgi:hypothetical protein